MPRSWFDRPWFAPAAIAASFAGNAFDLWGTYLHQPRFEHEANPLVVALEPYGYRPTWGPVIAAKLALWLAGSVGLVQFLRRRRGYYPDPPANFREFLTHTFYGRKLGWAESFVKAPRSIGPAVWATLAMLCLSGPYFAYLGYGNLAAERGWWRPGGFAAGRYWFDWGQVAWLAALFPGFAWLLWRDFRAGPARPASGG